MSRAASWRAAAAAQTGAELRLTFRRGENLLAMIGIPVALLLLLGIVEQAPGGDRPDRVATLLPGVLALAIVATGLVNLGIATAYERSYGVLRRLGGSPLGVSGLVAAKLATVLLVEVALGVILVAVAALVLGWRPAGGGGALIVLVVPAVLLGTAAFAGLGLTLAGLLRAEAVLLVANILFLVAIGLGGLVIPLTDLPDAVAAVAGSLPSSALRDVLADAFQGTPARAGPWLVLLAWAVGSAVLATRTFRWD